MIVIYDDAEIFENRFCLELLEVINDQGTVVYSALERL